MIAPDRVALALSDPMRLQILDLLVEGRGVACCSPANPETPGGICACDLIGVLGIAPSKLSYHMKELREAGLTTEQKRGRWVYYTLNRDAMAEFLTTLANRYAYSSCRLADPAETPTP